MTIGKISKKSKLIIGWREWCALPDLAVPGIAAKIDTGAKTSSLHAYKIEPFIRDSQQWVKFRVHPIQRRRRPEILCEAPVVDKRAVTSSNGETEQRFVISTTLVLGAHRFTTEITLTNRDEMGYRMLVGRQSLNQRFVVDPSLSLTTGDYEEHELYPAQQSTQGSL
ncbi:MAG: ATP-dependent zinc protease [Pseudomonadales bacterium]|jgi:ribosomal protein S6--L-glutamate ligase